MGILDTFRQLYAELKSDPAVAWALTILGSAIALFTSVGLSWWSARSIAKSVRKLESEAQRKAVQFGALHQRRAEAIESIYGLLAKMEHAAQRLRRQLLYRQGNKSVDGSEPTYPLTAEEDRYAAQLIATWQELDEVGSRSRIFLTEREYRMVSNVLVRLALFADHYRHTTAWYFTDSPDQIDATVKMLDEWSDKWESSMRSLEGEFRTMIGLEDSEPTKPFWKRPWFDRKRGP